MKERTTLRELNSDELEAVSGGVPYGCGTTYPPDDRCEHAD